MSKLTALKKQIAALEAQAERIAKEEMASAITKVKGIMAEFNLTIKHLTQAVGGKRAAKKAKAKAASVVKYADPKTGKTWSGFGRAPAWIAGAKNRDAFRVGKSAAPEVEAKAQPTPKKSAANAARAAKAAKRAPKPAVKRAAAKKTSKAKAASAPAKKSPAAKKSAAKKSAMKPAQSKQAAQAPGDATAAPAA